MVFAFVGALIISHQPRNVIGLLMMLPGVSLFVSVDAYLNPYISGVTPLPEMPSWSFLLVLWFSNWNWLLLVLPTMFIMVLFPSGKPLSPRWGWLIYLGMGLGALIFVFGTFARSLAPGAGGVDWVFRNPIGFIDPDAIWANFAISAFFIALPIWVILCAASLFVRFRRAQAVEHEQIKWLFYAGILFVAAYIPTFIGNTYSQAGNFWNSLVALGMLTIPIAIAVAILRYRLYDIDIIIRRTLQYALLTGLLALVYFGSVLILQSLFENLTGGQSPIVIVISTLAIAALFNPLRLRVQDFIDRRLYRKKYDAERTLANFALIARDEVNMDKLNAGLLVVVEETMQSEKTSLWLREGKKNVTSS